MELYRSARPRTWEEVIGQDQAVKVLQGYLKSGNVPHALLLSGPSGVGKTTIARVLRRELGCTPLNFYEVNAAKERGIDTIREIASRMGSAPLGGKCRIWLVDEAHQLTRREGTGDAQTAMLKMLEDPPSHIYFILATTNQDGLLPTIRSRCTCIPLAPLSADDVAAVLASVSKKAGKGVSEDVRDRIVEVAEGSARQAVQLFEKALTLKTEKEQLDCIQKPIMQKVAWDIVRAVIWQRPKWGVVTKILEDVTEDPEGIRRLILANARKELLKADPRTQERAYNLICVFEGIIFDTGVAGLASLARACYEALGGK